MTETILHVSDSLASIDQYETNEKSGLGGLENVVNRAITCQADAVVHTGNLFCRPDPDQRLVDILVETFHELKDEDIPLFVIEGQRETQGTGLDRLIDAGVVRKLTANPTIIGDVALYGIGNTGNEATILNRISELKPTDEYIYNIICMHERIWPPVWESTADISAYDVMETTDVHVSSVLAGGIEEAQCWESDDFEYRVQYPGSTNPRQYSDGKVARGHLVMADTDSARHEELRLTTSDIDEELARLKRAIDYQAANIKDVETKSIADLYGLVAHAKQLFEQRRQELREELLTRVDNDCQLNGQFAQVQRNTQRRRSLKSEDVVFDTLEQAGVDQDEVLTIDSSRVRELVDEGEISESSVFNIEEKPYIRLSDVNY